MPPLRALVDAGFDVALVVTRADKRRGRGSGLSPSPVKAAALELGLPVSHRVDDVLDVGADLGVVVAFGRIIKPHVLDAVPMVNLHFSLLPRWRGAAPVERAILAGDARTGVCLMDVDEGLDTGGVRAEAELDHRPGRDGRRAAGPPGRGRDRPAASTPCARACTRPSPRWASPPTRPRSSRRSCAWTGRVRRSSCTAWCGSGGAFTTFRGRRLKVWRSRLVDAGVPGAARRPGERVARAGHLCGGGVVTGDGLLELVEVQPEGKGRMAAAAWRRGLQPARGPDERLGP